MASDSEHTGAGDDATPDEPEKATSGQGPPQDDDTLGKAKQAAGEAIGRLTNAEQLIALGAVLIIFISDLIGNVLIDQYSPERTLWAVAVGALIVLWAGRLGKNPVPPMWILRGLGYLGGFLGLRQLFADIDNGSLDGGSILFALILYVGAGLMAIGANAMRAVPPPADQ